MPSYESSRPNGTFDSYLLLEDGSVFLGKHFGADISVDGEVGKLLSKPNTWFSDAGGSQDGHVDNVFGDFPVPV